MVYDIIQANSHKCQGQLYGSVGPNTSRTETIDIENEPLDRACIDEFTPGMQQSSQKFRAGLEALNVLFAQERMPELPPLQLSTTSVVGI